MSLEIPLSASKINLSCLGLTEIPSEIFRCKNLRKLNLSNNKIKEIPQELSGLKQLVNLDLSHNELTSLRSRNFDFLRLEVLCLNHNKLKNIPIQIGNQSTLKEIHLAYNELKKLPVEFSRLDKLSVLNISNNKFTQFPNELLECRALKSLWLNGNYWHNFPVSFIKSDLKNLKHLYCFGAMPSSTEIVDENYLKLLSIRGNSLSQLKLLEFSEKKDNTLKDTYMDNNQSLNIFVSYSHADKEWLPKIQTLIKTINFEDVQLNLWDDTKLKAGNLWQAEIDNAINNADAAILLVSTDFLASNFIRNNELPPLLEKAKANGTKILPVIVGRCRFTSSAINMYQSVNDPNKPLNALTKAEQDNVYYDLGERLVSIFKNGN